MLNAKLLFTLRQRLVDSFLYHRCKIVFVYGTPVRLPTYFVYDLLIEEARIAGEIQCLSLFLSEIGCA